MAKADILSILYSKERSPLEFNFDSLYMRSMLNFITYQDIQELHNIATSIRYSSKITLKYKMIDDIMTRRGFKKFHAGTNRVVYSYLEDKSFVAKIAIDRIGMGDNPSEYRNQFILKPFVTKVFEVSPCGTIAFVERVEPITSRAEFLSVADDVFDLLNKQILGEYVLEDIGTKYFMNYGLRMGGFGPVLLDYPYLFKLDGNKLYCNQLLETGQMCGGVIDYDVGFNDLRCTCCNKKYLATELQKAKENKLIVVKGDNDVNLNIRLKRGGNLVATINSDRETETIIINKKRG